MIIVKVFPVSFELCQAHAGLNLIKRLGAYLGA